jgi:Glycosyl hydrolases related to GH101 family, GH129
MKIRFLVCLFWCQTLWGAGIFTNGGFEGGIDGWRFWARDPQAGNFVLEDHGAHDGNLCGRVEHRGDKDWSLEPGEPIPTHEGEWFDLGVWLRSEGEGSVVFCVSTWNADGKAVEWSYAERAPTGSTGWQQVRTRVLVPQGIVQIQPRILGNGKVTVWVDAFTIRPETGPQWQRDPHLPATLGIRNKALVITLDTHHATLAVEDRRARREWTQSAQTGGIWLRNASVQGNEIRLSLTHALSGLDIAGRIAVDPDRAEFTIELSSAGELPSSLRFPFPFATAPGDYLVVPMNEGISYAVEDQTIEAFRLIAYGGHGICMPFWGVTEGKSGQMAIIETPDDAAIQLVRLDGKLAVAPEWEPQKQAFGYTRRLRYVFFDQGGHVAIAKRYRAYAQEAGLIKTLEEKRRFNPNVDLLVGAVNVWCWDRDAVTIVKEMKASGIERVLWSNAQSPENLRALNEMGVLTSRYDIYQDVMDPKQFSKLQWTHPDWTTAAWPGDIILDSRGEWIRGWGVEAKDGSMISCGVICDARALDYARGRVPAELETHSYKCRFIDTTTAAPWHECYQTNHPMTRSESKRWKMELLRYMSQDLKLVTGCETGHEAAVPYLHYFEGMLSLGPYRVPDAGRRMSQILTEVPERVAKFQLGHAYRLPLWELVYHDCVVAQWYWGDYSNKLPALWDKRDLFNVLYGTPPMFMFDRKSWKENRERFMRSYENTCPYVRRTGYSEMTDHRFLTADRSVQQTRFSNSQVVTVNFGSDPYRLADGTVIAASGFKVTGPGL